MNIGEAHSAAKLSELEVISHFSADLLRSNDLDDLLWSVARNVGEVLEFQDFVLYLCKGERLYQRAAFGVKNPDLRSIKNPIVIEWGVGIVGAVAQSGCAELISNTADDPRYISDEFAGHSELTVPVIYQGEVIAVFDAESTETDGFSGHDLRTLQTLANLSASRIASAIAELQRDKAQIAAEELRNDLERRVEARTRELQRSEARYRDFIDRLPDVVWRMDKEGVIVFLSSAVTAMTGFEPNEIAGLPFADFQKKFLVDGARNGAGKALDRRINGELGLEEFVFELKLYRKDGSQFVAEIRSLPIVDEDGAIVEIHGLARDISDKKLIEKERATLEDQLRQSQKMEAVGQLAGGIAHDFNNILTAISGYSELLLNELEPNQAMHHELSEIKNASERAAALTRQLLAFSRKQILQPKIIDLGKLVRWNANMLQRMIGDHIELDIQCDPNLYLVKADPGQIEQVMMNLVVNARDAMPQGGTIKLVTENFVIDAPNASTFADISIGDYVRLSVSDAGMGIGEDILPRIFEPFYTTKPADKGTGLGLSTVFGIIRQSGGEIEVTSLPNKGTEFRVYLPRVEAEATSGEEVAAIITPTRGTETLLIAEDEAFIRDLLKRVLEGFGYTVLLATNGVDALRIADLHIGKIDLLVTDVVMPQMGGRELAERLSLARPDTPIIYMSGYNEGMVSEHGSVDPNTAFVQKPFSAEEVAGKIREVLSR